MRQIAGSQSSLILHQTYWFAPAAASAPPPRFHGESNIAARLLLGEADKMGSTPLSKVMAVGCVVAVPWVVTIITASPFCKSAMVTAGMRFNIC